MSTLVDAVWFAGAGAGVALTWRALSVYRRRETLGATALAAYLGLLGIGSTVTGVAATLTTIPRPPGASGVTELLAPLYLLTILSTVPWLLFCLQYTGRYQSPTRGLLGVLAVPLVLTTLQFPLLWTQQTGPVLQGVRIVVGVLNNLVTLGYTAIGTFFLLWAALSTRQLRLRTVAGLVAAPIAVNICWRFITVALRFTGPLAEAALFASVPVVGSVGVAIALGRYRALTSIPAVQRIGREDVVQETADLVFILDERGRVTELNDAAAAVVADGDGPVLAQLPDGESEDGAVRLPSIESVVGHDVAALRAGESVELETDDGPRLFDPQLSPVTDHQGRQLGMVCSLRDVTDRELREQRLSVLNRVLRHNLRNRVDVIRAHAETLDSRLPEEPQTVGGGSGQADNVDGESTHLSSIVAVADEIAELGESARLIDQFVSESAGPTTVALDEVVMGAVERADTSAVTVETTVPQARLRTTRAAVTAALDSVIDNAVTYADTTVQITVEPTAEGYTLTVADDGPGIPDAELAVLDEATETPLQHGTGLGLWQLRWAVRTINGELSFDTTDGTTVSIRIPDQCGDD